MKNSLSIILILSLFLFALKAGDKPVLAVQRTYVKGAVGTNGNLDLSTLSEAQKDVYLDTEAAKAFKRLYAAAETGTVVDRKNGKTVKLRMGVFQIGGYRDFETQYELWLIFGPDPNDVAIPGTSKHGFGLAFDMNVSAYGQPQKGEAVTPEIIWMEENASRFGFYPRLAKGANTMISELPFSKGRTVNNYHESWHWYYDLAK